ncbi:MAG: threonine dehydratase [Halieaceae bacterium]|jgi:threonine dehydratase
MSVNVVEVDNKILALLSKPFYSDSGVQKTPLLHSVALSKLSGCNVYLKCENLQTTGSFKIRGATSALLNLGADDRSRGVITASSGNHGAATATAARAQGVAVSVFVPTSISSAKEVKIADGGATLIKIEGGGENAEREASRVARDKNITYLSPYNHVDVIAGQGTIAHELLDQLPELKAVFASVGGGGLISGIGAHLQCHKPGTIIVGCWPENATSMLACIRAGKVIEVAETSTLSDGTAGGVDEGSITLPLCEAVVTDTVTVAEVEIANAMELVKRHHGFVIEGAAGVAVAGMLKESLKFQGKNVVVVLCGENISDQNFELAMRMAGANGDSITL